MDYFNEVERQKQKDFAKWRDQFFLPIISPLAKMGISHNFVSFSGIVFLLLACAFEPKHYILISICIALYLFCDAIDGGIARYTNKSSNAGSIVDIVCDQLGVVCLSAACIYYFNTNPLYFFIFSSFYIFFIILIVYLNEKSVPTFKFLRVKYIFFGLYAFSSLIPLMVLEYFIAFFAIYYVVVFFWGLKVMLANSEKLQ